MAEGQVSRTQQLTCIIHNESSKLNPSEELTRPKDVESWQKLLAAAKLRNHIPIIQLAEQVEDDESIPNLVYHTQCRNRFTMKRDLDNLKRKYDSGATSSTETPNRTIKRQKLSESRIYKMECVFCKKNRYIKRSRTREALIKAIDLRSDESLRRIAKRRQDADIIAVTSRDIVAAEAHYHRSCYKDYTRNPDRLHHMTTGDDQEDTAAIQYADIEQRSYVELFEYMREEIIASPNVTMFNYQAAIWKRSVLADPQSPTPNGRGWKLETVDGHQQLIFDWMDGSPAPEAVLDLLSCKCPRACKLPSCVCLLNCLKCTDMCRLRDCTNQPSDNCDDDNAEPGVFDNDELDY